MKISVITIPILVFIFFPIVAFSQGALNAVYYKNIMELLTKRQDISDVKYIEKKYNNGNVKLQLITVKFKDDTLKNRYWWIGKSYFYYRTGELRGIRSYDIDTKAFIDTSYDYNKIGDISSLIIFDINTKKVIPKKVYFNFKSRFSNYYLNFPEKHRYIKYKNGKKFIEKNCKFIDNSTLVVDGDMIYYKDDGTVEKVEKYEKGALIK